MRTALVIGVAVVVGSTVPRAQLPSVPQLWEAFGPIARVSYVEGFKQGSIMTYGRVAVPTGSSFNLPTWAEIADSTQVATVMSDLYRDPANVNIRPPALVWIARDKLLGKDVEPLLRQARADAARSPAK